MIRPIFNTVKWISIYPGVGNRKDEEIEINESELLDIFKEMMVVDVDEERIAAVEAMDEEEKEEDDAAAEPRAGAQEPHRHGDRARSPVRRHLQRHRAHRDLPNH